MLGIPVWMLVGALVLLALRARSLGRRPGDLPVRVRDEGSKRWQRGHGLWVHDVFVFNGTLTFWSDRLVPAVGATTTTDAMGFDPPRRLPEASFVSILGDGGAVLCVASVGDPDDVLGPFASP